MRALFFSLITALVSACSADVAVPLAATDIEITPSMTGTDMRAAYMTLTNNSDESILLTSVSSPQFGAVAMHESVIENDIARMHALNEIEILSGASVRLQRGGKHLMLSRPVERTDANSGIDRPGSDRPNETVTLNLYSHDLLILSVLVAAGAH